MPKNSNWFYNPIGKFEDTRKAVKRDHPKEYGIADKIVHTVGPVLVKLIANALVGNDGPAADQKAAAPAPRPK